MTDYSVLANVQALSEPDPELTAFLQTNPPVKLDFTTDRHALRAKRHAAEKERAQATLTYGTHEHTKTITMRDGYQSEIRITQSADEPEPPSGHPLIVLIYGGGWLLGTSYQLIPFARPLAYFYKATVVTVSYRLGPEYKFPTATYDIYDSVKWLALNASSFGANPKAGFVLGGVSAGATMTAVVAQQLTVEKFSPRLTGQWLSVPNLLSRRTVPERYRELWISRDQNADAPGLTTRDLEILDRSYEPDPLSPDWSPINAGPPSEDLPPAYIQVAGCDPLRDDGLIWERILREHAYPHLTLSRKSNINTIAGIGWLLGETPDLDKVAGGLESSPGGG